MKLSFARNRLNALLRTQAFGAVGSLVPRITDMFVSGSVVGVNALAGIVAVMPVTIGALFVGKVGDSLIVMAFAQMDEETAQTWVPKVKRF